MQRKNRQEAVTPFDWRSDVQQQQAPRTACGRRGKGQAKQERPLSAAERAQRVLATRWASPYSRAGLPSKPGF